MESKPAPDTQSTKSVIALLIEPVWNRNISQKSIEADNQTFNRTSMESKRNSDTMFLSSMVNF